MPDVPEHLVPQDGLTNATIRYGGLDVLDNDRGVLHRFYISDEDGDAVGTFHIETALAGEGSVDHLIGLAHTNMINVLRQAIFELDLQRQAYEGSGKA